MVGMFYGNGVGYHNCSRRSEGLGESLRGNKSQWFKEFEGSDGNRESVIGLNFKDPFLYI